MAKAKDHIIAKAPTSFEDIKRFLIEMPYLTAKLHGKKYRFMYQVYSSSKYREQGKRILLKASMYIIKNMPMNYQTN